MSKIFTVISIFCFLSQSISAMPGLKCSEIFHSEERALEVPRNVSLNRKDFFRSFLEGKIRRSALFKLASLGNFQIHLDAFVAREINQSEASFYDLGDGTRVKVSTEEIGLLGSEELTVVVSFGTQKTYIRADKSNDELNKTFLIATKSGDTWVSSIYYSTLTTRETRKLGRQAMTEFDDLLDGLSKDELEWLARKISGIPAEQNPRPPITILPKAQRSDQVAIVPFNSFLSEAIHRVGITSPNTGGSLKGFQLLASLFDAIYAKGFNAKKINEVPKTFEQTYDGFLQSFILKTKIVENLKKVSTDNRTFGARFVAKVLPRDELGARANYIAKAENYGGYFDKGQEAFTHLPEGQYLTMRIEDYFQAVNLKDLEDGRLNIYVRNLKSHLDDKTYQFSFDSQGRPVQHFDENSHRAYIATQIFLENLDNFATNN